MEQVRGDLRPADLTADDGVADAEGRRSRGGRLDALFDDRQQLCVAAGERPECEALGGERADRLLHADLDAQLDRLGHDPLGVGERALHGCDEGVEHADRPADLWVAQLSGDVVDTLQRRCGVRGLAGTHGGAVGREVHDGHEVRVVDVAHRGDRLSGERRPDRRGARRPERLEHVCRHLGEHPAVRSGPCQFERLARRGVPSIGFVGADQPLRDERGESSPGCDVGVRARGKRRLEDVELLDGLAGRP